MKLLLALMLLASPARAADLLATLATNDPKQVLDALVALGQRIDLSDPAQVRAAIGPVTGLKARGALASGFVGYASEQGEIVYNAQVPRRIVLLASPHACLPYDQLRQRLTGPEFAPPLRKTTVALYTEVRYLERRQFAFTYVDGRGCMQSFGIAQDRDQS